jgi:DNA ligase-1
MKREAVMLAHTYDRFKHHGTYTWSIKLDGMRAFWDGGITRRKPVPWCNEISTGLFSRFMKPIFAPDWWLDQLPHIPLDGELWLGPGKFQTVMSICKRHKPDPRWKRIIFNIIDYPGLDTVFDYGRFESKATTITFDHKLREYLQTLAIEQSVPWQKSKPFRPDIHNFLNLDLKPNVTLVEQHPFNPADKDELLNTLLAEGHEGIVLRRIGSIWTPERSHDLLKIKPWSDAEGVVVGCTYGRETDKGSRLLGKMGALIVEWNNVRFKLSGFSDDLRTLIDTANDGTELDQLQSAERIATANPEEVAKDGVVPLHFAIGSRVTFKYRELSDGGIPKDARYWRKR